MVNREAELIINQAVNEAMRSGHGFVTIEHLLLAMIDADDIKRIINACGGCADKMRMSLEKFLSKYLAADTLAPDQVPKMTVAFRRVIQRAAMHAQRSSNGLLHEEAILVSILAETSSYAVYALRKQNVKKYNVVSYIAHNKPTSSSQSARQEQDKSLLSAYTIDMCKQAKQNKYDSLIGRKEEMESLMQVLCQQRKCNPIVIGEAGVGKTTLLEGFAHVLQDNAVPPRLQEASLFSLNIGAIIAGSRYRGDFEERFTAVLQAFSTHKTPILLIEDIHAVASMSIAGVSVDVLHMLKPFFLESKLKFIGITTFSNYRKSLENYQIIVNYFQKIEVGEPSRQQVIEILQGIKGRFEDFHHVRYSDESLGLVVDLSSRYLRDRHLPDKAVDVIDEVGASLSYRASGKGKRKRVTRDDVCKHIAKIAKIPVNKVSTQEQKILASLAADLKKLIFGQDRAIDTVCEMVLLSRSGLEARERPIGSFLFSGATGVGKTELAKQLSMVLGVEFARFDMSEYMEKHTVSRLIGAPPGYVGFEQGGLLTETINHTPHTVLLLDEIEKAHADLLNVLLQIMDYGFLTDAMGRRTDFRNVLLIMTTNVHATETSGETIGFGRADTEEKNMEAIKNFFSPEFRNRLDSVVFFSSLEKSSVGKIIDKFLHELATRLQAKGIKLKVTAAAKAHLSKIGYNQQHGARPLFRAIQDNIKKPLAKELLFNKKRLENSSVLTIGFSTQKHFSFNFN